jgi:methionyl-tRNA synthetase
LGNFANRVAVLSQKYYEGKAPAFSEAHFAQQIGQVRKELSDLQKELCLATEEYRFRDGLGALMNMARAGNKFLAETEPWKLQKTDPEATATAMAFALEILANIAIACEPYLPHTHEKLCAQLNLLPLEFMVREFWNEGKLLKPFSEGHPLGEPGLLFTKIEDEQIAVQWQKLQDKSMENNITAPAQEESATKQEITYDDFAKLDLRIAQIITAEKVEKADKLLKLTLSVGAEERTVVSGIAQHFMPEAIVGKQVLFLANLAPRKMRGIESQGMILMAEDADGKLVFVSPAEAVQTGSSVS